MAASLTAGLAACHDHGAQAPEAQPTDVPKAMAARGGAAPGIVESQFGTPVKDRVATLGLLNKRNNETQDLVLKAGEARRVGNVVVKLSTCEKTLPWEHPPETGAFVQVFVEERERISEPLTWHKVFSGWLFRNSPSLNVVEHPVYDVWVKDCAMKFPGEEETPQEFARSSKPAKAAGRARAAPPAPGRTLLPTQRLSPRRPMRHRLLAPPMAPRTPATDPQKDVLGVGQQLQIAGLADLDRAQRPQVPGHELAIDQAHAAQPQCRHQPRERHLRRIRTTGKHALAAEHPVEPDAIQTARPAGARMPPSGSQHSIEWALPVACNAQVAGGDALADPGFAALALPGRGAGSDDLGKGGIAGDGEAPAPQCARQRMRTTEAIERQDRPSLGFNPIDVMVGARIGHRKDAAAIGEHQQPRLDRLGRGKRVHWRAISPGTAVRERGYPPCHPRRQ